MLLLTQAPPPIAFGTDGWRARVGEAFTFDAVRRCADGVAGWITEAGTAAQGVVVAYDRRFASEHFAVAAAEILLAYDIPVLLTSGPVPTPVASYAVQAHGAAGAVVITASHNPWTDNGFKVKAPTGAAADATIIAAIERGVADQAGLPLESRPLGDAEAAGLVERIDPAAGYERWVGRTVDLAALRWMRGSVLVDPLWGAGAGWLPRLLGGGRLRITEIHSERNPYFGGVNPEPIPPNVDEGLAQAAAVGCDLALLLDGDADRLGAGDERGRFIHQLQVTGLLAYYLAEHRRLTDPVVVSVNNTAMAPRLGARFGFEVHETPVGFKHLAPRMIETGAMLGAEESGGYAFGMHLPERDGLYAALLLLDLVRLEAARGTRPLSRVVAALHELAGPSYYRRVDIHLEADRYAEIRDDLVASLVREGTGDLGVGEAVEARPLATGDGVKYHTRDGSWLLLRASGTEPLVRVYAEAHAPATRDHLMEAGERLLRAAGGQTLAVTGEQA